MSRHHLESVQLSCGRDENLQADRSILLRALINIVQYST